MAEQGQMIGMAGFGDIMPPLGSRAIPATRKDMLACGACCCGMRYIDTNRGLPCCATHAQFLCFAFDGMLCGEDTSKFGLCNCFGLTILPKFGCCMPLKEIFPPEKYPNVKDKADYYPIWGYCMAGLCFKQPPLFKVLYLKAPTTCCSVEGWCCCIFFDDCAFPCDEHIPVACSCLPAVGYFLFPKQGCCTKAGEMFPVKEPLVGGPEYTVGPPRFSPLVNRMMGYKDDDKATTEQPRGEAEEPPSKGEEAKEA